ncbi:MAG TPA: AzlD domain-containing protein [Thermoanaerobacterales bacterium]|jgi:branched-subunit amino acid transport protein|nr:AzlD domain-containing protein [Thermoanaerobacterales bacterium]
MTNIIPAVLIMAVVTYIPRVFPIVIFKNKLKSRFLLSFLYYMPFAVLGAMTFPSILYSTGHLVSAIVGLAVALFLAYREKGLMLVAVGAILSVYLCELLFF